MYDKKDVLFHFWECSEGINNIKLDKYSKKWLCKQFFFVLAIHWMRAVNKSVHVTKNIESNLKTIDEKISLMSFQRVEAKMTEHTEKFQRVEAKMTD